jgi:hypothetical protein
MADVNLYCILDFAINSNRVLMVNGLPALSVSPEQLMASEETHLVSLSGKA